MPVFRAHHRPPTRFPRRVVVLLAGLVAFASPAVARGQGDESSTRPPSDPSLGIDDTIVAPPGASLTPASDPYDTYAVWRAEERVKRARAGLIATAASFGVGWIFLGTASSQCDRIDEEVVCNNAGQALGAVGLMTAGGGLVGMIVSGILLPVRQKKARDVRREIHQRQNSRLRWDVDSGKVVF